ncbi:PREDICTED: translation initiation factor IF-2-like, partial [Chinchilla lanigera]|uniref:translation initiation factor IF-2-like n=1 Tax=Chinchilla lanigera TaxID=34839 RepID=UPI0006986B82
MGTGVHEVALQGVAFVSRHPGVKGELRLRPGGRVRVASGWEVAPPHTAPPAPSGPLRGRVGWRCRPVPRPAAEPPAPRVGTLGARGPRLTASASPAVSAAGPHHGSRQPLQRAAALRCQPHAQGRRCPAAGRWGRPEPGTRAPPGLPEPAPAQPGGPAAHPSPGGRASPGAAARGAGHPHGRWLGRPAPPPGPAPRLPARAGRSHVEAEPPNKAPRTKELAAGAARPRERPQARGAAA